MRLWVCYVCGDGFFYIGFCRLVRSWLVIWVVIGLFRMVVVLVSIWVWFISRWVFCMVISVVGMSVVSRLVSYISSCFVISAMFSVVVISFLVSCRISLCWLLLYSPAGIFVLYLFSILII